MPSRFRILLVEDDADLADNFREILGDLDQEILISFDGESALNESNIDVALVDVGLPDVTGTELIPKLRSHFPDIEIILVTGDANLDSAIQAVEHGAFAYLLKPVSATALLNSTARALTQVQLRQERESLSKALAASETLYRGVVENVDALIVGVGESNEIVFVNQSAALATANAPVLGLDFTEVFGDDAERQTRRPTRQRERPIAFRFGGQSRFLRWTFTNVESGGKIRYIAIGIDITETLELQKRSAESEALAAIGTLTAGLAHEIRNPLNAAALQLQLLARRALRIEDDAVRQKVLEPVEIVRTELGRLTTMLNDFLGLARPQEPERESFEVAELFRSVGDLEGPFCEQIGITLSASGNAEVFGDRDRLKQVLVNLVANAREAILTGPGTIHLRCELTTDRRARISVEDSGPGLSDANADPFTPFYTTKPAGTGLGLAIVRKIVRMHGSDITLQNGTQGAIASFELELRS